MKAKLPTKKPKLSTAYLLKEARNNNSFVMKKVRALRRRNFEDGDAANSIIGAMISNLKSNLIEFQALEALLVPEKPKAK